MLIRSATPADMESLAAFPVVDPVGNLDADWFRRETSANQLRPEGSWLADDGGRVVARALWWGRSDSKHPLALDCLQVLPDVADRAALATEILSRGHAEFQRAGRSGAPEFNLMLRTYWRDDPAVVAAVQWRAEAARAAGLTNDVERLRYEWTPDVGVPAPSTRLTFSPAEDEEFLEVFRRVAVGSLDVTTRRDLEAMDADVQARGDLEFYRDCPGERSWWRIAERLDGETVGFAIPSATPYNRNVGYLGVIPELRGQGYVDDLLSEITRFHAADGADRITATTDMPNAPMAAAFERAGYLNTEVRMIFEAPAE